MQRAFAGCSRLPNPAAGEIAFTVARASRSANARLLERAGLVRSAKRSQRIARLHGQSGALRSGEYALGRAKDRARSSALERRRLSYSIVPRGYRRPDRRAPRRGLGDADAFARRSAIPR